MNKTRYYIHATKPFADGTAYVARTGQAKVCVSRDGDASEITGWDADYQMFVGNGDWVEISEAKANNLVKAAAMRTESNSKGTE